MKASNLFKKSLLGFGLMSSFVVFGSIYQSAQVANNSFMNDSTVKFAKRLDESKDRFVASSEKASIAIQYLPVNKKNNEIINKKWEIIRIENESGEEVFNKINKEGKIIVELNLVKTSQIMINNDKDYLFDLSFLHSTGSTIALFRAFGGGYEIIEAVAVKEITKEVKASINNKVEIKNIVKKNTTTYDIDPIDLTLERALVPSVDNRIIIGEEFLNGEVTIGNNSIQGLVVNIEKNGKRAELALSDIQIETGGSFVTEIEGVQARGILTNNGKDSYRIRFATGPLKGALLNFVTADELERITTEREEIQRLSEEKSYESSVREGQLEVVQTVSSNTRRETQSNVISAGYEASREEPTYVAGEEIERQGYTF